MVTFRTKKFRDTIHGYIEIPDDIVSNIIDTEQFQRLRYIEQTSMRPLYPAARHDRFIHSLGVYWLGKKAFKYFQQNSQDEFKKNNLSKMDDTWWKKQEILFSIACLLHDCAHAPFSHTLEDMYALRTIDAKKVKGCTKPEGTRLLELDAKLLEQCKADDKFESDFIRPSDGALAVLGMGSPHEKMSAYCLLTEYNNAIKTILENRDISYSEQDTIFMARMIIGCLYINPSKSDKNDDREEKSEESYVENSIKNCIISMLNSSSIDVDGLDYIVRDAYMSGIDNFNIDYQRLLSSFTVIPVEIYDSKEVKDMVLDEIWLKGTEFDIGELDASSIYGEMSFASIDKLDIDRIKGIECTLSKNSNIFQTTSNDCVEISDINSGKIELKESCRFSHGKFSGIIKNGRRIITKMHPQTGHASRQEYMLGYNKNSLSIIQSTVEARNHEYLWVYTHPKVLYSANYLQCELLRNSAKYLCCCANKTYFKNEKLDFDCEKCKQRHQEEEQRKGKKKVQKKFKCVEDDMILYIMGYHTYFKDVNLECSPKKLSNKGFTFYRTCDDDLNALFKRIYHENAERGSLKSDKIEENFKEYFSRQHKSPLWKSFAEYGNINKLCDENSDTNHILNSLSKKVFNGTTLLSENYAVLSPEQQKIFDEYEMHDVLIIKSSIKTKVLSSHDTFIKFPDQTLRLIDIFDKSYLKDDMSKDFYYIFADMKEAPSYSDLLALFAKLNKIIGPH